MNLKDRIDLAKRYAKEKNLEKQTELHRMYGYERDIIIYDHLDWDRDYSKE